MGRGKTLARGRTGVSQTAYAPGTPEAAAEAPTGEGPTIPTAGAGVGGRSGSAAIRRCLPGVRHDSKSPRRTTVTKCVTYTKPGRPRR
jgi:hypothetical protein